MRFRHELSYDAGPAEVFEMLADPAFREKVSEAMDVVSCGGVHRPPARTASGSRTTRSSSTEGLPSFAKKFAGETTRAIQVEEWQDAAGGSLRIDAPGKPSSIDGTIELLPDGAGTIEVVELEIKVKVPLVGGKLEGLVEEQVRKGMDIEHEVGKAWLKGER